MNSLHSSPTPTDNTATTLVARRSCQGNLEAAFASEVGTSHPHNEDCCTHAPCADNPVFCAVADGVGGGAFGDVASQALVRHCASASRETYSDARKLADWLRQSDAVVREAIARRGNRPGASTLVAAWFLSEKRVHVTNIGDCRAYHLSQRWLGDWRIKQITMDQTYGNLGRPHPPKGSPHDPACMAGVGAVGTPEIISVGLGEGDLLLLCSDGLHKFVADEELLELCAGELKQASSLAATCQALVRTAKLNGSYDDVSALLVRRRQRDWYQSALPYWLTLLLSGLLAVKGFPFPW